LLRGGGQNAALDETRSTPAGHSGGLMLGKPSPNGTCNGLRSPCC
jgi:hypothetical protein